ncbi:MAG: AbrB family transcriptional regulator, partial [bacterium]
MSPQIKAPVSAICFGIAGALGGYLAGLPAPFLTGPALVVSLACVFGFTLSVPLWLRDTCFVLVGIGMGSGVTPEVVDAAARWPMALITLLISLVLILHTSSWLLRKVFDFDRTSAVLASSPGHFSYILGLSTDTRADIQRVSIVQSLRVMILTMIVPLIFVLMGGESSVISEKIQSFMSWSHIFGIALVSGCVGWGLKRLGIPAAFLLGGMLVSALSHVNRLTHGDLPEWLSISAFLVMGTLIGSRFSGITPRALGGSLAAGLMIAALATAISVAASFFTAMQLGLPINHVLIAYAPGGVETMAAMAILLG